ncbi:hypothetical protein Scep_018783 [Stephania cephalantha]|uniref:Uncharacterized protein n=1 Tax=Stephania cephalantha TaxID=152367 RepID=A0AAP0NM80_9MAGN
MSSIASLLFLSGFNYARVLSASSTLISLTLPMRPEEKMAFPQSKGLFLGLHFVCQYSLTIDCRNNLTVSKWSIYMGKASAECDHGSGAGKDAPSKRLCFETFAVEVWYCLKKQEEGYVPHFGLLCMWIGFFVELLMHE